MTDESKLSQETPACVVDVSTTSDDKACSQRFELLEEIEELGGPEKRTQLESESDDYLKAAVETYRADRADPERFARTCADIYVERGELRAEQREVAIQHFTRETRKRYARRRDVFMRRAIRCNQRVDVPRLQLIACHVLARARAIASLTLPQPQV